MWVFVCAHIVANAYCFLSLFALCFHAFAIVHCCSYHLCDFCWLPEQKKATERCCRSKRVLIIPCMHTRDAKYKTKQKNNPRLSQSQEEKKKEKTKEENYTKKKIVGARWKACSHTKNTFSFCLFFFFTLSHNDTIFQTREIQFFDWILKPQAIVLLPESSCILKVFPLR